jgi:hypothetical protein
LFIQAESNIFFHEDLGLIKKLSNRHSQKLMLRPGKNAGANPYCHHLNIEKTNQMYRLKSKKNYSKPVMGWSM